MNIQEAQESLKKKGYTPVEIDIFTAGFDFASQEIAEREALIKRLGEALANEHAWVTGKTGCEDYCGACKLIAQSKEYGG